MLPKEEQIKLQDFDDPSLFLEILNQLKQGTDFWEQIPDENQRIVAAEAIYNKITNDPLAQMEYTSMLKAEHRAKARFYEAEQRGKMRASLEFAKNMKSAGESLEEIIKYTNLTKEQIDAL